MQRKASARRVTVKGKPGIYYRVNAAGKRQFEITFLDAEKRRRWRVVDGDLKAAEALLEDTRARVRREGKALVAESQTLAAVFQRWLATKGDLRPRTIDAYRQAWRVHLEPRFGSKRIDRISEDDLA